MVSDANEVSLLGRERDRFKAAGVVVLLVLAGALGGFGLLLWVTALVTSHAPAKGWLFGGAFVAVGALLLWTARKRRASYLQVCDSGFAIMKSEGVPRDIVRWDDITDVKHHTLKTITNGIQTDSKYTCTVHVANRKSPINVTNKDFRDARTLGAHIQAEYARRRPQ